MPTVEEVRERFRAKKRCESVENVENVESANEIERCAYDGIMVNMPSPNLVECDFEHDFGKFTSNYVKRLLESNGIPITKIEIPKIPKCPF